MHVTDGISILPRVCHRFPSFCLEPLVFLTNCHVNYMTHDACPSSRSWVGLPLWVARQKTILMFHNPLTKLIQMVTLNMPFLGETGQATLLSSCNFLHFEAMVVVANPLDFINDWLQLQVLPPKMVTTTFSLKFYSENMVSLIRIRCCRLTSFLFQTR